jgi:hypothetical protein
MMKIRIAIDEIEQAIAENKVAGLDFVEIIANAVPVPEGWRMVQVTDEDVPLGLRHDPVFDHPSN